MEVPMQTDASATLVELERLASTAGRISADAAQLEDDLGRLIYSLSGLELPEQADEFTALLEQIRVRVEA